jgi:DNA-binding transcriptional MerR regulator
MRIGELAASLKVSTKTLRLYEERNLIPRPARSDHGYRIFGRDAVRRARLVVGLRGLGLSLQQIIELLSALKQPKRGLRRELAGLLHEQIRGISERIAVLQGQLEDLEARYLALMDTPRGRPPDCICGALNQTCTCGKAD